MIIKIYNKEIKQDIADELIKKIKARKGLENSDDKLIAAKMADFLKKDSKALDKLSKAEDYKKIVKSKEADALVKHVRAEMRPIYGLFIKESLADIKQLLMEEKAHIKEILGFHVSSSERMDFYKEFYQKIFEITGKPESIVDIACGLNPLSFEFMGLPKKTKYYAIELNQNDADAIDEFFRRWKIDGKAFQQDITKETIKFKADIAFTFKIFDIIDNKITERIIKELDVKWIAASFSTKTVSKKDMRFKRRSGFQKMLRRLGLGYKTITFPNEIVYLIKKE
ncbi:MAG: hypothetical protein KKE20_01890 [Nanoarchaeota archaeon]|nr:hypothetical protein [Nanoarchaeota archaeon]